MSDFQLEIKTNLGDIQQRIAAAARKSGRQPEDISLIAVTKTQSVDRINAAISAGVLNIGENRIQEARQKFPLLANGAARHMIGHLQRNKVKYAIKLFDIIQSVDNIALAEEIDARCAKLGRKMPILIEVNTSGEASKIGCEPREALTLLKAIDRLPNLETRGFMTIALYSSDIEMVRPCFRLLRELYEEALTIDLVNANLRILSMGMSSDFETAIEEGATMVRIGSALFGAREA